MTLTVWWHSIFQSYFHINKSEGKSWIFCPSHIRMKLEWRYILKSDGSPSSDPIITNSIARIDDPDFDLHANFGGRKSGETSWLLRMLAACARLLLSCAPFVIMRAFCYLWRRYRIRWFSGSRWDTLLVWYLNYLLNFKTDQDLNTSNLLPFWVCIHLSWKVV